MTLAEAFILVANQDYKLALRKYAPQNGLLLFNQYGHIKSVYRFKQTPTSQQQVEPISKRPECLQIFTQPNWFETENSLQEKINSSLWIFSSRDNSETRGQIEIDPKINGIFGIFSDLVLNEFSFLIKISGYKIIQNSIDERTGALKIIYAGQFTGIEFWLDLRIEEISCKICLLNNGQPPGLLNEDAAGNCVREGVWNLLVEKGVRTPLLTRVSSRTFEERIPIMLGDFAKMLQDYAHLLADDPAVLNVP